MAGSERGRSRSRSMSRSVSMSRSPSRSPSPKNKSVSKSRSPSRSRSRSLSRSRSRSRSYSRGRSYSRSRSRSRSYSSRSRSRSLSRSPSRTPPRRRRSISPRRRSPSPARGPRGGDEERLKTIVVSHLTKNVTEKHLEEIFNAYGEIKKVDMPINRRINAHRGFANIIFSTKDDAQKAVAYMDRGQLDGSLLSVSIKRNDDKDDRGTGGFVEREREREWDRPRYNDGPRGGRGGPSYSDNRRGGGAFGGGRDVRDSYRPGGPPRRGGSRSRSPPRRRERSVSRSPPRRRPGNARRPSPSYR